MNKILPDRKSCLLVIGFFLSFVNIVLTLLDKKFQYSWFIFGLYVISVVCLFFYFFLKEKHIFYRKLNIFFASFRWKELLVLLGIVGVHFLFLSSYPFVSVGDEVRDSGLDARKVVVSEKKNFFDYGNYNGYGNIIPVVASFFYRIFGDSVLTYRFPAAIVGILEICFLYILLRQLVKNEVALVVTLLGLTLPLHLFFARTEFVVALNSFWLVLLLGVFWGWLKKGESIFLLIFFLFIGVSCQLHAAVKIAGLWLAFVAIGLIGVKKESNFEKLKKITIAIAAFFVGFGPMLLFSKNAVTFFHSENFFFPEMVHQPNLVSMILILGQRYVKTLLVWVTEVAISHYLGRESLLTPALFLLMIIGITVFLGTIRETKREVNTIFLLSVLSLWLLLPLTNSAITNGLNADHRLSVMLPVGHIFIAVAVDWLTKQCKNKLLYQSFYCILLTYSLISAVYFFGARVVDKDRFIGSYAIMNTVYYLQQNLKEQNFSSEQICFQASSRTYKELKLLHWQEQFQYFFPNKKRFLEENPALTNTTLVVYSGTCQGKSTANLTSYTFCQVGERSFHCPAGKNSFSPVRLYTDL